MMMAAVLCPQQKRTSIDLIRRKLDVLVGDFDDLVERLSHFPLKKPAKASENQSFLSQQVLAQALLSLVEARFHRKEG
jgi:hypothetical protein